MKNVRFDPLAKRELADAAEYYEEKVAGLGDALLLEVGKVLRQLSEVPLSCPAIGGGLRKRPLFRFPYSLLYRVSGEEVLVVAVMHQRRGPKYIAKRLRGV